MDILKIRYCGRVSAGKLKRDRPDPLSKEKPAKTWYLCLVLRVFGLSGVRALSVHLGSSSLSNLQKFPGSLNRRRRGQKGISSQGRLTVRDAALYLDETVGRCNLSFLTLTIPPEALTPELFAKWSDVARKLRQRLVYALEEHGVNSSVVGVVEIQEKRQGNSGDLPCLHWHLVFQGRKPGRHWLLSPEWFRDAWQELLERALGFPVDCSAATRVERIWKDASNYLAKYMSKGVKSLSMINTDYLPPSWYMCTRNLLRMVKSLTRYVTGGIATELYDYLTQSGEWLRYSKDIKIQIDEDKEITVGWYGDFLSREHWRDFCEIFDWANKTELSNLSILWRE